VHTVVSKMSFSQMHAFGAKVAFIPTLLWNLLRSRIDRNWYDRINETIVLGALPFPSTARKLVADEAVKGVITLNQEYETKYLSLSNEEWQELGVTQLRIPTLDYDSTPTVDEIENAIAFIKTFREKQQSVYVHCKAGRGRSAFLVVCYLVKEENMRPEDAFEFVKSKRSHVLLWSNQRRNVEEYACLVSNLTAKNTGNDS